MSGDPHALPLVLVVEDGDEYWSRFSRLLGNRFRFSRAGSLAEAAAALALPEPGAPPRARRGATGPDAADPTPALLLLDLDFRRTTRAALVDERGGPAPPADAARLAAVQGILILRALRARGASTPALLCADLDDPARAAQLARELGPLDVSGSSEGLSAVGGRLDRLLGR